MKKISILLLTTLLFGFGKSGAADYKLFFSAYNYAEHVTYFYRLEGNALIIGYHGAFDEKETVTKTVILTPGAIAKLQAIKLDELEEFYFNHCVMTTSGTDYFVGAGFGTEIKEIRLHNYYKEEIAQLASELNKSLPEKSQINYEDADTKQDCK